MQPCQPCGAPGVSQGHVLVMPGTTQCLGQMQGRGGHAFSRGPGGHEFEAPRSHCVWRRRSSRSCIRSCPLNERISPCPRDRCEATAGHRPAARSANEPTLAWGQTGVRSERTGGALFRPVALPPPPPTTPLSLTHSLTHYRSLSRSHTLTHSLSLSLSLALSLSLSQRAGKHCHSELANTATATSCDRGGHQGALHLHQGVPHLQLQRGPLPTESPGNGEGQ